MAQAGNAQTSDQKLLDLTTKAEQGDVAAQMALGLMYLEGRGVPKDESKANYWLEKAAEQSAPETQYNLGMNLISPVL